MMNNTIKIKIQFGEYLRARQVLTEGNISNFAGTMENTLLVNPADIDEIQSVLSMHGIDWKFG